MKVFRVEFSASKLARNVFHNKRVVTFQVISNGTRGVIATPADNAGFPRVDSWNVPGNPSGTLLNPDSGGIIEFPPSGFRLEVVFEAPINLDSAGGLSFYFLQEGATAMSHFV